uniref:Uncharacterized protein n=1 Tax=Cacopsylla melanoneura TaxID=428564 RepID=A0A8D8R577_9HEMI
MSIDTWQNTPILIPFFMPAGQLIFIVVSNNYTGITAFRQPLTINVGLCKFFDVDKLFMFDVFLMSGNHQTLDYLTNLLLVFGLIKPSNHLICWSLLSMVKFIVKTFLIVSGHRKFRKINVISKNQ